MNRGQSQYKMRGRVMRQMRRHAMQTYRQSQSSAPSSSNTSLPRRPTPAPFSPPAPLARKRHPVYTEADRNAASLGLWVFFWFMVTFFLFFAASVLAAVLHRAMWPDVWKPGAWSLFFVVIVFFRWSQLARITHSLEQNGQSLEADDLNTDEQAAKLWAEAFQHGCPQEPQSESRPQPQNQHPPEPRRVMPLAQQSAPSLPPRFKSVQQKQDEEAVWLRQEARWRADAKQGRSATEEERVRWIQYQEEKNQREREIAQRNTRIIREEALAKQREEDETREVAELSAEIAQLWAQKKA